MTTSYNWKVKAMKAYQRNQWQPEIRLRSQATLNLKIACKCIVIITL